MLEADFVRLKHMLDAANEIVEFTADKNMDDFKSDRKLHLSVVHLLEIIGEAGSRVSSECKDKYFEIPWKSVVGMRNRLIHGYFDINLDIVWSTVTKDIPPLINALKKIIDDEG